MRRLLHFPNHKDCSNGNLSAYLANVISAEEHAIKKVRNRTIQEKWKNFVFFLPKPGLELKEIDTSCKEITCAFCLLGHMQQCVWKDLLEI